MVGIFKLLRHAVLLLLLPLVHNADVSKPPHIVFIMADDMGWNDVSFHGSDQILTPNIDTLAYQGVILQQYYSEAICTPARTALLTGKYPSRLGMQGFPLYNSEDRAIPVTEKLLPAYLKSLGYSTNLVGKWHVGMSRPEYLPIRRGFDYHYGIRGGFVDYYTYNKIEQWPDKRFLYGLDLFEDMQALEGKEGYLTDLLTQRAIDLIEKHNTSVPLYLQLAHGAPHAGNDGALLQTPPRVTNRNKHIAYSDRRLYADMVNSLDESIGKVVQALSDKGILDDTLIVFISDNGAPSVGQYNNWGTNLPFRGIKHTPWEGAVRVPAFVWHSSLKPNIWNGLMHITDWLPTIVSVAGGEIDRPIDGTSQWDSIRTNSRSSRSEVLVTIDDLLNFAALRAGDYKIVVGNLSNSYNGYYGQEWLKYASKPPAYLANLRTCDAARALESNGHTLDLESIALLREGSTIRQLDNKRDATLCEPRIDRGCLFNVARDPEERHDLWSKAPVVAARLLRRLKELWLRRAPRTSINLDPRADPETQDYVWRTWIPDGEQNNQTNSREPKGPNFSSVTIKHQSSIPILSSSPSALNTFIETGLTKLILEREALLKNLTSQSMKLPLPQDSGQNTTTTQFKANIEESTEAPAITDKTYSPDLNHESKEPEPITSEQSEPVIPSSYLETPYEDKNIQ